MVLSSSAKIWKDIEGFDSQKQRDVLEWQLQAREPIRRFADIRLGDHLVTKRSTFWGSFIYEHHFLCIGFENNGQPKIIHYYNTESILGRFFSTLGGGSGKSLGKMGMIQTMTLPNDTLITEDQLQATKDEEWEMARVVWPDELRRYSVEKIIARAQSRLDEGSYHPMKNNCESFVMWCLCDLKISPQANRMRKAVFETGVAMFQTGFRGIYHGVKQVLQFLDDFLGAGLKEGTTGQFFKSSLPRLGIDGGAILFVLVEIGVTGKDIYSAWKKYKSGVTSEEELVREVADKVMGMSFRAGASVAGMLAFGVFGALIGVFGGHLLASYLSELLDLTC